jgi:16S rRNA (uracil1498-N3)-methyltransferase
VRHVIELAEWLADRDATRAGIVLDPEASDELRDVGTPADGVDLLVGPEGGFTDDELARAAHAHLRRVRMGPRVLRTETASLAALAAINLLWGDLR